MIVAPFALVSVWKIEFGKTVHSGVLGLCTAHRDQHQTFKDLYTPYKKLDAKKNDSPKDHVIVLTSKKSLDKHIMADEKYYHLV